MSTVTESVDTDLDDPIHRISDIPRILAALRLAAREAILDHKRAGDPIAVWENGQVVWIAPEDIPEDDDPSE